MTNITEKLNSFSLPVPLLAMGHLVADMYSGFLIPILPLIALNLKISLPMAGLLITFSTMFSHFAQPLYGYLSDITNKRIFIISGLIIACIATSLTGCTNDYLLLLFLIVIGNLGIGLFHPQATALTGKSDETNQNSNMGIFVAGGIVGYALGPMISSSLVTAFGLRGTLLGIFPGLIMALVIYLFLPKEKTVNKNKISTNILAELLDKKNLLIPLITVIVVRAVISMSLCLYLPFEWENNLGYSVASVGLIMMVFSFVSGFSSVMGGKLANSFNERTLLIGSFLLSIPFLLLSIILMKTNGFLGCAMFIIGGSILQSTISINIVIPQRLFPNNLGVMSGITGGFSWGIAGLLLYPIGILIDTYNTYITLSGVVILAVIPTIILLSLPDKLFNNAKLDPLT